MNLPPDFFKRLQVFLLNGEATRNDVEAACAEAKRLSVASLCVHSSRLVQALFLLEETEVKVSCIVGFPFGASDSDVKRYEAEVAVDNGAQAIEVILNLGKLKEGDAAFLVRELRDVVATAEDRPVTVVGEMSIFSEAEKRLVADITAEGGAKLLKTSSGLKSASVADVKLLRSVLPEKVGVVAAGHFAGEQTIAPLRDAGAQWFSVPAGSPLLQGYLG